MPSVNVQITRGSVTREQMLRVVTIRLQNTYPGGGFLDVKGV